jgi:hypothetical protein
MSHLSVLSWLVHLLLGSGLESGQQTKEIAPSSSWEQWLEKVPVGGDVIVGVMPAGGRGQVGITALVAQLPANAQGMLCVEVTSMDGRYLARHRYQVSAPASAVSQPLRFPTRFADRLRAYPSQELAVLARLASNCDGSSGAFVPTALGGIGESDTVSVFLNSRLPTDVILGAGARVELEIRCVDLRGPTTAFNLRCDIPKSELARGRTLSLRFRQGRQVTYRALPLQRDD